MFTAQAIQILVFLFPGALVELIVSALHPGKEKDKLRFTIMALAYSLLLQIISTSTGDLDTHFYSTTVTVADVDKTIPIQITTYTAFLALLVSIIVAVLYKFDIPMRIFRAIKLTEKTVHSSSWADIFTSYSGYITINFDDGTRLRGVLHHYSDSKDEGMFSVCHPAWIDEEKIVPIPVEHVLIPNIDKVRTIEFHN